MKISEMTVKQLQLYIGSMIHNSRRKIYYADDINKKINDVDIYKKDFTMFLMVYCDNCFTVRQETEKFIK